MKWTKLLNSRRENIHTHYTFSFHARVHIYSYGYVDIPYRNLVCCTAGMVLVCGQGQKKLEEKSVEWNVDVNLKSA